MKYTNNLKYFFELLFELVKFAKMFSSEQDGFGSDGTDHSSSIFSDCIEDVIFMSMVMHRDNPSASLFQVVETDNLEAAVENNCPIEQTPHKTSESHKPTNITKKRKRGKNKKVPISKVGRSAVINWLLEHTNNPYPPKELRNEWCSKFQISQETLKNLLINSRRRYIQVLFK